MFLCESLSNLAGFLAYLSLFVCFIVRISQHDYVFHVWLLFITVHILSQWQWKCEVVGLVTFSSRWQRLFFQMVSIKIAFKKLWYFSVWTYSSLRWLSKVIQPLFTNGRQFHFCYMVFVRLCECVNKINWHHCERAHLTVFCPRVARKLKLCPKSYFPTFFQLMFMNCLHAYVLHMSTKSSSAPGKEVIPAQKIVPIPYRCNFRITFGLFFKASPGAYLFIWKLVFICTWMKTDLQDYFSLDGVIIIVHLCSKSLQLMREVNAQSSNGIHVIALCLGLEDGSLISFSWDGIFSLHRYEEKFDFFYRIMLDAVNFSDKPALDLAKNRVLGRA